MRSGSGATSWTVNGRSREIELNGLRLGGIIIGVLLILAGGTFALQGAGMLGTGSLMDSNPIWIYIGSFVLLVGLVLLIYSSVHGKQRSPVQN